MIELRNVTRLYGEIAAVRDLSLTVSEAQVCVLIGPSGSGKSTVLRMINRLLEPTRGTVLIRGRDIRASRPELLRRQIGYVIQHIGLFPHMSVAENIGVVPRLLHWSRERIAHRSDELLGLVGLPPDRYRDKMPHELSGGEAQRIGVARALAADPPILLMDEPFGAVDPLNREALQEEFLRIQRELRKTVVFVTHDLDEAIRLADTVVLMKEGRIVQHDPPEDLLARPADAFVHDFVGTDRALKRLVRFQVGDFMRPARSIRVDEPLPAGPAGRGAAGGEAPAGAAEAGGSRFRWVVSAEGRLIGWLDLAAARSGGTVADCLTPVEPAETAVHTDSTLKAALSRMLGQGIKAVPVLDRDGRLVGEISLREVDQVTEGGSEA